jgi:hypothetical protein
VGCARQPDKSRDDSGVSARVGAVDPDEQGDGAGDRERSRGEQGPTPLGPRPRTGVFERTLHSLGRPGGRVGLQRLDEETAAFGLSDGLPAPVAGEQMGVDPVGLVGR